MEGGDAEDDRGDEGDLVALEQVGGHAGAVADVVAHVVGDGGRVAGVVLGDARLDLADEVGADVGGLGEDAAADAEEQGEQRATEAEADEDGRAGVLEEHDDDRGAEQAEADGEHAGDAAGAERDLERGGQRAALGGGGGAHVAAGGQRHADEAGEAGQEAAGDEGQRAEQCRTGRSESASVAVGLAATSVEVTNTTTASGMRIMAIVLNWRLQVGRGALLDRRGDLDHLRRALVLGQDALHQEEADGEGEQRRDARQGQDGPLTALRVRTPGSRLQRPGCWSCVLPLGRGATVRPLVCGASRRGGLDG